MKLQWWHFVLCLHFGKVISFDKTRSFCCCVFCAWNTMQKSATFPPKLKTQQQQLYWESSILRHFNKVASGTYLRARYNSNDAMQMPVHGMARVRTFSQIMFQDLWPCSQQINTMFVFGVFMRMVWEMANDKREKRQTWRFYNYLRSRHWNKFN